MRWLFPMLLLACTVDDVIVDTGGPAAQWDDAETLPERPAADDPDVDPTTPEAPNAPDATALGLTPDHIDIGAEVLVFVHSDAAGIDLRDVVDVDLYGAPDVSIATWSASDAHTLAMFLEVSPGSPAGTVAVVLESERGEIWRLPVELTVQ